MGRIVRADDFTNEELQAVLDHIDHLDYFVENGTPQWVQQEAEKFSAPNPKPSVDELRAQITATVHSSMGWDDPHDREKMLHAAIKSFYLLWWIDHLDRAGREKGLNGAVQLAMKVNFNPKFTF
jgi:hypothetical protein